jgi:hypothetical protein
MTAAAMTFTDMSLVQLGSHAYAHYRAAEKSNEKVRQHIKSAGLYLIAARDRLKETKEMTFPEFLSRHCKVAKSRAYEIIAIAEGRTTEDEVREKTYARQANERSRNRAAKASVGYGQSVKQLPDQRSPDEIERSALMSTIHSKLERLTLSQLHAIERNIPEPSAANSGTVFNLAA